LARSSTTGPNAIEIQIEEIAQVFHSLDPYPFREKDLWLGCQLAADRNISLRLVADRSSTQPVSAAFSGAS
jgi:hypothetical protein